MKTSAILLCSGSSSRMAPFENKFLFEYLGKSVFFYQLESLFLSEQIENIFVVANQENEEILKKEGDHFYKTYPQSNGKIYFSVQSNLSEGMMGGVKAVENIFPKDQSICIMSSNDVVENWFLKEFLSEKTFPQTMGKICGKKVDSYFPGGYLEIDGEKNIQRIIEKPGEGNEPSNLINLVIHWFKNSEELFSELNTKDNTNDDAYEQTLQSLIDKKWNIAAVEYTGKWQALKYPWHLLDMKEFFLNEIHDSIIYPTAYISENAVIKGPVIIKEGVQVFDFAVIQGPCYIGKNSIIGNHCLVRESHIGNDCCIGQGSEIARSYLRNEVFTHQSYIGDSVVDNDVNFGAGCKTGNLRHDGGEVSVLVKNQSIKSGKHKLGIFCGAHARFGIQTSFSPGIKIGKNCWSFPQIFFSKDIPENAFIKQKKENIEYDIRENKNK